MVKEWFKNFLSTTAITILLITLVGVFTGDTSVKIASILPSVAANAVIHLGLIPLKRTGSTYYIVEMLLEFAWVLGVILLTGYLSGWFVSSPVWITVAITAAVFLAACLINVVHIHNDLEDINKQIKLRQKELELE